MTDLLQRPSPDAQVAPAPPAEPAPRRGGSAAQELTVLAGTAVLVAAACLPLLRVLVGTEWLPLVVGAGLLSLLVSVAVRRVGGGPLLALGVAAGGWVVFAGLALMGETLRAGIVPTTETAAAARSLWLTGFDHIATRRSPTFAERGLLFILVTAVWFIAHVVDALAVRLRAPVKAVLAAMVLWVVPLAIAPRPDDVVRFAVPFLAAASVLLLAYAGADLARWGRWVAPAPFAGWRSRLRDPLAPVGVVAASVAITAGVLLAGILPGFGEEPWYELRDLGSGTTSTGNPIVQIRGNLTDPGDRPLLEVTSAQPVYLRTTSLDVYENEEWTNAGIRGVGVERFAIPFEQPIAAAEPLRTRITVRGLPGAVLVPAPYQAVAVDGDLADRLAYDRTLSTFTLTGGGSLARGDSYTVDAAIPAPGAEALAEVDARMPGSPLTALPSDVPGEVIDLARDIVDAAGAETPFDQALALQEELRSWEYSLDPPQGHGTDAMVSFITTRIGYCEQYAGTMAVMLRTLGIPARVAVGTTPGSVVGVMSQDDAAEGRVVRPDAPDTEGARMRTYRVTQANAHAWVEVLFPGYGWIAFEPTPRADGDVLVPSAANLAPDRTLAQQGLADAAPAPGEPEPEVATVPQAPEPQLPDQPDAAAPQPAGSGQDTAGRTGWRLGLLALVGLAGAGLLANRQRVDSAELPPVERARLIRRRLVRLARGLGAGPLSHETADEWLTRLSGRGAASTALATGLTRAEYAPAFDAADADTLATAAAMVEDDLLADVQRVHRPVVWVRGWIADATVRRGRPQGPV